MCLRSDSSLFASSFRSRSSRRSEASSCRFDRASFPSSAAASSTRVSIILFAILSARRRSLLTDRGVNPSDAVDVDVATFASLASFLCSATRDASRVARRRSRRASRASATPAETGARDNELASSAASSRAESARASARAATRCRRRVSRAPRAASSPRASSATSRARAPSVARVSAAAVVNPPSATAVDGETPRATIVMMIANVAVLAMVSQRYERRRHADDRGDEAPTPFEPAASTSRSVVVRANAPPSSREGVARSAARSPEDISALGARPRTVRIRRASSTRARAALERGGRWAGDRGSGGRHTSTRGRRDGVEERRARRETRERVARSRASARARGRRDGSARA